MNQERWQQITGIFEAALMRDLSLDCRHHSVGF
jgi:hypothetical protein